MTAVQTDTELAMSIISRASADDLKDFSSAIRNRKDILDSIAANDALQNISVGSRVRIRDNIRPMYLQGLTAVVTYVSPYEVKIDFEEPALAGRYSRGCRVRLHQIELVS